MKRRGGAGARARRERERLNARLDAVEQHLRGRELPQDAPPEPAVFVAGEAAPAPAPWWRRLLGLA